MNHNELENYIIVIANAIIIITIAKIVTIIAGLKRRGP